MKKIPNWIIVCIFLALLIASKFLFFKKEDKAAASKAKTANVPLAVNYAVVNPVKFENDIFTTGRIGALNQIDILPEVGGKVTAIYFKEGETVSKGALLLKLNDADLQAQLQKTTTQLKLSEEKVEMLKKLTDIKGVSKEEYDIQENEAASFKADIAYIQAQIAKTNIVAPFSGVVGLKNVSEGSYISTSAPIASLVQLKPVYVEFSVPEKYSSQFKTGIRVKFSSDYSTASKSFSATIYAIEPRIDETTKTLKARALYSGDQVFYPGSFTKVFVNLGETKDALMVPTQCVIPTLKGQKIFLCKNGTAVESQVTIGVRTDEKIQILSGINPGDTVITTGLLSVKKDAKLKLLKPAN